ncbi:MAG: hypothetical protein WB561_17945 [Terracidiphilus sp.]
MKLAEHLNLTEHPEIVAEKKIEVRDDLAIENYARIHARRRQSS